MIVLLCDSCSEEPVYCCCVESPVDEPEPWLPARWEIGIVSMPRRIATACRTRSIAPATDADAIVESMMNLDRETAFDALAAAIEALNRSFRAVTPRDRLWAVGQPWHIVADPLEAVVRILWALEYFENMGSGAPSPGDRWQEEFSSTGAEAEECLSEESREL